MAEDLRNTYLKQTDDLTYKRRFGLFSQLVSTAIGDDNPYKIHMHPRDESNKPKTQPKNIMTSPTKSGQLKSSFFGPLNTLASFTSHDVYIDPARRVIQLEKEKFQKGKIHQSTFFPVATNKLVVSAPYPWKALKTEPDDPKRHRNSEGGVIVQPRGFYTNCKSYVQSRYNKHLKHMTEPYDNQQVIQKERREAMKSKQGEVPFKLGSYPPRPLNKSKSVYGSDVVIPEKRQKSHSYNHYKHETVFRCSNPTKSGIFGFLAPFPEHIPSPPLPEIKPKLSAKGEEKKQVFKSMSLQKSRPTPSISANPINMRKYINHSFNKRF